MNAQLTEFIISQWKSEKHYLKWGLRGEKSINEDRNAKESNKKMPFSSHQIVKDV